MEESSERVVRLEQHDEITMGDDLIIHSIPQDLALAVSAIYDRMMVDVEELLFNQIRDTFLSYTTPSYLGFVGLPDEECQLPRPALCKARRRRDPPPRVSRRSSQVSPPIYLRHRFLPQSRKDSSSRRQRWSSNHLYDMMFFVSLCVVSTYHNNNRMYPKCVRFIWNSGIQQ